MGGRPAKPRRYVVKNKTTTTMERAGEASFGRKENLNWERGSSRSLFLQQKNNLIESLGSRNCAVYLFVLDKESERERERGWRDTWGDRFFSMFFFIKL